MTNWNLPLLLAYLDGALDPAAVQAIEADMAEAPSAARLVHRIGDVTRRLRLAAPPIDGDGIDPNSVAEYLDQTLSPDRAQDYENVCLSSDIDLAEAAACHQILSRVLGEPAVVRSESRRRMYDLLEQSDLTEPLAASCEAAIAPRDRGQTQTYGTAGVRRSERRPVDRLRRTVRGQVRRWLVRWRRPPAQIKPPARFLSVVVLVVFAAWCAIQMIAPHGGEPSRHQAKPSDGGLALQEGNAGRRAPEPRDLSAEHPFPFPGPLGAASEPSPDGPTEAASNEHLAMIAPPDKAAQRDGPSSVVMVRPTAPLPADSNRSRATEDSSSGSDAHGPASAPAGEMGQWNIAPAAVGDAASTQIVFARPEDEPNWRRLTSTTALAGHIYAAPAGFRPVLLLSNGLRIELVDGVRLGLQGFDAGGAPTVSLEQGRLIVSTAPLGNETSRAQRALHIRFDDYGWRLSPVASGGGTVELLQPHPREGVLAVTGRHARAEISAYPVDVTRGAGPAAGRPSGGVQRLGTECAIILDPSTHGEFVWRATGRSDELRCASHPLLIRFPALDPRGTAQPRTEPAPPAALDNFGRSHHVLARDAAQAFHSELLRARLPLVDTLDRLKRHHPHPQVRAAATNCLAIVQDFSSLRPNARFTRYPAVSSPK